MSGLVLVDHPSDHPLSAVVGLAALAVAAGVPLALYVTLLSLGFAVSPFVALFSSRSPA